MNIDLRIIDHHDQRYNTIGDWWFTHNVMHIRVSRMDDWRYEMAIGLHEIYEAMLCHAKGITEKEVTSFDIEFENSPNLKYAEPGDDPSAPYYNEHARAIVVEQMVLADLDVVRYLYEENIGELYHPGGLDVNANS